jgi:hypothetical protein
MKPIGKIKQYPKAFARLAKQLNELTDRVNLLSTLEAGPGLKLTESTQKLRLEVSGLSGELDCTTTPPTVNIFAGS